MIVLQLSCIKEVPLIPSEVPYPSPVVFMFLTPDSGIQCSYSRVAGINRPAPVINNAVIQISKNGVYIGNLLSAGQGRYTFGSNTYQPRDSFSMECLHNGELSQVKGVVPSKVVISSADTQTLIIPGVGPAFVIDFSFTDSAIDDNYYRLRLLRHFYKYTLDELNKRTDSVLLAEIINVSGSALPFIQNNFNKYNSREILFTDATMNGTKPLFRIYTPDRVQETLGHRTVSITILLENLEKPLYDYYNTRNAHLWQQQSISQLPGLVTGNVPDGYGVIGAYTTGMFKLNFK